MEVHNVVEISAIKSMPLVDKLGAIEELLKSGTDDQQRILDILIECRDCKDRKTKLSAIDIVWKYKYFESMLVLLEADSKFPKNFTFEIFEHPNVPDKLKVFVTTRVELHKRIKENRFKEVENFISNHKLSRFLNHENKSALETAAEFANVQIVECLVDLLLQKITVAEEKQRFLEQVDAEGNTLLSVAAKSGQKDNVDYFIRRGIDVNRSNRGGKNAVDLAWKNRHYDVVLALLKVDSDIPKGFKLDELNEGNSSEKVLKRFVEERNEFHEQIKISKGVNNFITNQESKIYLNSQGQSALFTAIKNKKFRIYAYLRSKGLIFKNKVEEECLDYLTQMQKLTLKAEMIHTFPPLDDGHIYYLLSKSRSQKPVDDFKKRIETFYRLLDSIKEVSLILQVVQYADYLDIIFDFDHEYCNKINPTTSEGTMGIVDFKNGRIYVGAKTKTRAIGTLAHELTHFAMFILYKNDCKPFGKPDVTKSKTFAEITAKIRDKTKCISIKTNEDRPEIILARAFGYEEVYQQAELIVRVPHILAQYPDEGRAFLNSTEEFKLLFDYYSDQAPRCKEFIEKSYLIKPRNRIEALNGSFGDLNIIEKYGINFKHPTDLDHFLQSTKQVFLVKTESTLLGILSIYESLIVNNNKYSIQDTIFIEFNSYKEKQGEVNYLFYNEAGKILCIRYSDKGNLSGVLEILNHLLELKSDKKLILIISKSNAEARDKIKSAFGDKYEESTEHRFTLNDLTNKSQRKLLEREVILQGQKVYLNNLIDESDDNVKKMLRGKPLDQLITNEKVIIGSKPLGVSDFQGAYSELYEELDKGTLVEELLLPSSNDIFIISGISESEKKGKLIEYFNGNIEESRVDDLKSRIEVLNVQHEWRGNNRKILVTGDQFKEQNFKEICHNIAERQIYWIHLKTESYQPKFILQQIYNPDFYLSGKRFNNEVVIGKSIKEYLVSSRLDEIFIIGGKYKSEVKMWFSITHCEEMQFDENCKNNKIKFVTSKSDVEVTFKALVEGGGTVHWLEFKQDQLVCIQTCGSLKNLCKYRENDYRETKPLLDEDELIKEIKDEKVSIIAGDPGIGKSTTLVKLYESKYESESGVESISKSHWLIRINFKDHLQAIRNIDFTKSDKEVTRNIVEFLLKAEKNINGDFTKVLLDIALRMNFAKPLLLALDAFDEVLDERDRDKIICLLKKLKDNTKAKFWITTRMHYEQTLEAELSTFAINICPMDDSKICTFIKKYLINRLRLILSVNEFNEIFGDSEEEIGNRKLQQYTEAFLGKMSEVFRGDITKFIGTPLQLYLMLEGSAKHFKTFVQGENPTAPEFSYLGSDIWEVYEKFIDRKYVIVYEKKKIKEKIENEIRKIFFDNFHKDLASTLIFKSKPKNELMRFKEIVLSAGILRSDGRNIDFIHPTFSEFFAAIVLIEWLEDSHEILCSRKELLMIDILSSRDYEVVRAFLNAKLLKMKIEGIKIQGKYEHRDFLEVALNENNRGIVNFILENINGVNVNDKLKSGALAFYGREFKNLEMVKFLVNERKFDVNAKDQNGCTLLCTAAKFGDIEMVKFLIDEKKADFNAKDKYGQTALHWAAQYDNMEMVKFLTDEKNADFNAKDDYGQTALHLAAECGNMEILKFLIDEKNADFNAKGNRGRTALHLAAKYGNMEMVKFLIDEKNADFNTKDNDGQTALHLAAKYDNMEMVKFLIDEKNADFNAKDNYGLTALHLAAKYVSMKMIKFLIHEKNADFTAKDNDGQTALHLAAKYDNMEMVKFLIEEKNADFNAKDNDGQTALHLAAQYDNMEMVEFLIDEKNADFNAKNNCGQTALHMASQYGKMATVKFLIEEKNADFNAKDIFGQTALHLTTQCGNMAMVKFLIDEKNADFNAKDKYGQTALHLAAQYGNMAMVKFLIDEKNADFNAKDKYGQTALHLAAQYGNMAMVKFLIDEKNANFNAKDNDGQTALHLAAQYGNMAMVKFLIDEKNADFNAKDKYGQTALHLAAQYGKMATVKFLIDEKDADFNAKDNDGQTALYLAAASGEMEIVKFLIDEKNAKVNNGNTVLQSIFNLFSKCF